MQCAMCPKDDFFALGTFLIIQTASEITMDKILGTHIENTKEV